MEIDAQMIFALVEIQPSMGAMVLPKGHVSRISKNPKTVWMGAQSWELSHLCHTLHSKKEILPTTIFSLCAQVGRLRASSKNLILV